MADDRVAREVEESIERMLEAARNERPSAADVEALADKIIAASPAPVAVGSSLAAVKLGAIVVVAVGGMVALSMFRAEPSPSPRPPPPPSARAVPAVVTVETSTAPAPEPAPVAAPVLPNRRGPRVTQDAAVEGELLHRAKVKLHDDAHAAIAIAREHERRFEHGVLEPERDWILIQAYVRLKDDQEVSRRARLFIARHADTPYCARAAELLSVDAAAACGGEEHR